jgi:hypothetical protein
VRVFACMKVAADAGLAPRVLCSNTEDGIAIIDRIEDVPFPATQHGQNTLRPHYAAGVARS